MKFTIRTRNLFFTTKRQLFDFQAHTYISTKIYNPKNNKFLSLTPSTLQA